MFIGTKVLGSDILLPGFDYDQFATDEVWSECHLSKNGWVKTKMCYGCTETQSCSK